jgi:hypothetical protein
MNPQGFPLFCVGSHVSKGNPRYSVLVLINTKEITPFSVGIHEHKGNPAILCWQLWTENKSRFLRWYSRRQRKSCYSVLATITVIKVGRWVLNRNGHLKYYIHLWLAFLNLFFVWVRRFLFGFLRAIALSWSCKILWGKNLPFYMVGNCANLEKLIVGGELSILFI